MHFMRKVRGNLYGSIDLTELEDIILSHRVLQRLRRVRQTAFLSLVFPGATHSRFEHSLGVMHQASRAWNALHANQQRLALRAEKHTRFAERENKHDDRLLHGLLAPTFDLIKPLFSSDYTEQTLRLAALMHDIGHPPFSHSGERFLPTFRELLTANELPEYLHSYLESEIRAKGEDYQASHETLTILLIDKVLNEVYTLAPHLTLKIHAQDVISIITPKIHPRSDSELASLGVHQLCHELVSGEIDIDRIDYLLRDSKECGVVYGIFDVDRIMDSLVLYSDPTDNKIHLAILYSGLAAFEDYLRARQSMYIQLYFHKTSVACEAMLSKLASAIPEFHLPAHLDAYIDCDEMSIYQLLLNAAQQRLEGYELTLFHRLLDDLLKDRHLWKRVYEVTHHGKEQQLDNIIEEKIALLTQHEIPFQRVSSSTVLTKFQQRKKAERSSNYLKLVKKDGDWFPRVVPLEDYSRLVADETTIAIDRLYVPPDRGQETFSTHAKQLLLTSAHPI